VQYKKKLVLDRVISIVKIGGFDEFGESKMH